MGYRGVRLGHPTLFECFMAGNGLKRMVNNGYHLVMTFTVCHGNSWKFDPGANLPKWGLRSLKSVVEFDCIM